MKGLIPMVSTSQKVSKGVEDTLIKILNNRLEKEVENIIDIGIETYENLLLGVVVDTSSMASPENFYDSYIDRLKSFKFIDEEADSPTITIPDAGVFVYGGPLTILKFIVEGISGIYLELPEEDMSELLKAKGIDDKVKRRIRSLPGITDSEVPINMRFRLLHTRGTLSSTVQAILDKKLTTFPFSNSLPLDLFTPMQEYYDENVQSWIDNSQKETLKTISKRYT